MTSTSLPRKIFQGVAKRADMFRLFDRHAKRPDRFDGDQSVTYAGEWFEIDERARHSATALDARTDLCDARVHDRFRDLDILRDPDR